jgi:hypothetical protein
MAVIIDDHHPPPARDTLTGKLFHKTTAKPATRKGALRSMSTLRCGWQLSLTSVPAHPKPAIPQHAQMGRVDGSGW